VFPIRDGETYSTYQLVCSSDCCR